MSDHIKDCSDEAPACLGCAERIRTLEAALAAAKERERELLMRIREPCPHCSFIPPEARESDDSERVVSADSATMRRSAAAKASGAPRHRCSECGQYRNLAQVMSPELFHLLQHWIDWQQEAK